MALRLIIGAIGFAGILLIWAAGRNWFRSRWWNVVGLILMDFAFLSMIRGYWNHNTGFETLLVLVIPFFYNIRALKQWNQQSGVRVAA
jgi:hypothetical protein